ncbi:MAG TPA: ATP-binding protein, partial [Candidatus Nitrosotenuis sp.]|nr:ATP-binding protein [Candidatus Nitrosotenuis sp.]
MIHFRKLQLINWDYWDNILLPLDDPIVNIVGPNGSGKTTLLDALRHLLRARLSSRRTLRKYLRRSDRVSLIRAVVSNAPGSSTRRRPFAPQIHDDEVTLACLMRRNGGEWESFYYILPRDVGHQEIMALDPRQALSPMTYSRHLERAGVSRSVLRVLALEQGATDQLCEKSPRELLELVFDVFGDREVIEQYQTAREEQRRAEAERDEQRRKVAGMELSVQALAGRVNQYREFHRLVETRERYRQLLPRLEYLQAQSELAGAMEALEA